MTESGWTLATLKEHMDSRLDAVDNRAKLALEAAERSADKADKAFEKRMDNTNEWRATYQDLITKFVTKEQVRWTFMALIGGIGLAIAIISAVRGIF